MHGPPLNVNPDHIANNTTLTASLLAVLGITLAMVGACCWGIYRQIKRARLTQRVLEDLEEPQPRPATLVTPPEAPWEKAGDWWKNPPVD
jgi:hypothetical protein